MKSCPKCHSNMTKVSYASVDVDRCIRCGALWFDMMELERLTGVEGSEGIDIGNPEVGQHLDTTDRINCPVCQTQMLRMVDSRQPHIRYESCTVCHGVFFDAGEFKDYKEQTVIEFVRGLFARRSDGS